MTDLASGTRSRASGGTVEWPTLGLILATYALWALSALWLPAVSMPLALLGCVLALVLHSSLSHEAIHGHPTRHAGLNAALMFPALGLFVPYLRFRDTHLAHHRDSSLTDPYDDPESNYLDPARWQALPRWRQALCRANNTLLGRLLIGPALGQAAFLRADLAAMRAGDRAVRAAWAWHFVALLPVLAVLQLPGAMPLPAYIAAAYGALSVLKIRTFLEHCAHERARGRTVIVEDRGPLAFLFLNNNLHVVHHMHPRVPWYRLPEIYFSNRQRYLTRNNGYRYASYGEVFRRYLFKAKDPVPHPIWRRPL